MDENEFFRGITVRICGSLEIEKALYRCFEFLHPFIPIDDLLIGTYDKRLGAVRAVVTANAEGVTFSSDDTPLSPLSRRERKELERQPLVRKVTNVKDDPVLRHIAADRRWKSSSGLVARLVVEGEYIGALAARVEGENRYTDEHLHLWSLINEPVALAFANSKQFRDLSRLKDIIEDDKSYFETELRKSKGTKLIGADFGLREVMENIQRVARLQSPVLITGETGTGKELVASAIHDLSGRNSGPFVKVNCGAIPDALIDSELFGHEKGAFTGALYQKRGRFERAHRGTIFLDEVSELPPQAQVRLLRVVQEKEIERVGGTRTISIDVRIISATNRNLSKLVADGRFREDLYFRLSVFPIAIPPLRLRKGDIPTLVHHFIKKKSQEMALPTAPMLALGEIELLMQYDWPGNVRELENAVERAIILSDGRRLRFDEIIGRTSAFSNGRRMKEGEEVLRIDELEAKHVEAVLQKVGGKISGQGGAAELLGINANTLRHRMTKLGIRFGRKFPYGVIGK